jgi:glycosyltransferase involved in cell wall biosynthesis
MRVTIVSTYPPRPCGIAVFSSDLRSAMVETDAASVVDIVSILREALPQRREVATVIRQDLSSDYAAAARAVMARGTDVVLVEHEFGIFGGDAGDYVVNFVKELSVPIVVTLHTVLTSPSRAQAAALRALCDRAALVTVFTETARRMVTETGLVNPERVRVVPHGAPDILTRAQELTTVGALASELDPRDGSQEALDRANAALRRIHHRTVLSTFGLISASKGLELAIQALPAIVARHPEVVYLIAGQTHPEVIKHEGESYRLRLERLVRDLNLTDHVLFLDHFLPVEELAVLLARTDLYLTPYRSREQIVSGALSFAVAAGCAVVSTPYFYAEDLLSSGAGALVPFGDAAALAAAVNSYLEAPDQLAAARTEARRMGKELAWRSVAQTTMEVLDEAVRQQPAGTPGQLPAQVSAPRIRPEHLLTLVDDVGIMQHALGTIPLRSTGYCLDDVARLAIVALGLERELDNPRYQRILVSALAFIFDARDPDRPGVGMRNFMDYSRRWLDQPHSGDHVGRAVWALGSVVGAQPLREEAGPCLRVLMEMLPVMKAAASPREVAFTVLGLSRPALGVLPEAAQDVLHDLSGRLSGWYEEHRRDDWLWFEQRLTYDNARLPQALIAAGHRLDNPALLKSGLEALDWYAEQCALHTDTVRLVGNRWRRSGEPPRGWTAEGDEQPLDAAALVEALAEATIATGQREYGRQALRAFEWFLGRNCAGLAVYDFATGGCHDGLGPDGLNDNEGAESTLAYLQAWLAIEAAGLQASAS